MEHHRNHWGSTPRVWRVSVDTPCDAAGPSGEKFGERSALLVYPYLTLAIIEEGERSVQVKVSHWCLLQGFCFILSYFNFWKNLSSKVLQHTHTHIIKTSL